MADMRPGSSLQDIAAFGQKLADLLQTTVELNPSAADRANLKDVMYGILVTSGTLRQLHVLTHLDEAVGFGQIAKPTITPAYLDDIKSLAVKCDLIYKTIMLIAQKAAARDKSKDGDDEDLGLENLKHELLTSPIPDPASIKSIRLVGECGSGSQRFWVAERMERCDEQLQWIRMGLLVHLHIIKLAQQQTGIAGRETGAFEQELISRSAIQLLRKKQVKFAKTKARKQEKAQRQWALRNADTDSDTESVASAASSQASSATTKTAVDDEASATEQAAVGKDIADPTDIDKSGPVAADNSSQVNAPDTACGLEDSRGKGKTSRSVTLPGKFSLNFPAYFFDWKQKIFGTDDRFKTDWPSNNLEAYYRLTRSMWKPTKIPFGHKRLHYGLSKMIKDGAKGTTTWTRYLELEQAARLAVDAIVKEANHHQSRERVCVALQEYNQESEEPFIVVFFSIRKEPKPISFKDAVGRTYVLPFETCRTWEGMKSHITEAFNHVQVIGPHVMEGHFDLLISDGHIILPHLWGTTIKPGASIDMRMWPVETPLRNFYGNPPFQPMASVHLQTTEHQAQHLARMRQIQQQRIAAMKNPPPPPPMRAPVHIPMMGGPQPPPPPGGRLSYYFPSKAPPRSHPRVVDIAPARRHSRIVDIDEDDITEKEDEQMMFVDFVEELEKAKTTTVADLLTKFTNLKDIPDEDCLADFLGTDSDYDSDGSTSTSSFSFIND
ncbi:hypothetical protein diail_3217 [Diaporthe ilicicola]|nr:hypothetical protein diail_3217 [Diaporthe ilicicola]